MNGSRPNYVILDEAAEFDALAEEEAQREADRVAAFCHSGQGHVNVYYEGPDPSVGIFGHVAVCEDCDTDLTQVIDPAWDI